MAKKVVTNDGKKGGWLVGKRHYDKSGKPLGGIKAVVTDAGGKPVELEGGEVIINREASKKYWKELSKINQSAGNGVAIEPPSDAFDEDPNEDYENGGKIEFNANHIPNKWILNYAIKIKEEHPEIWKLGGNIFGNQAFINLKRVAERGHWLDSEEWMYKKWRSYVARHQRDYRIEGVVAMLKWVDKVEKGWQYMKNLIEEKIKKLEARKSKKMNDGGNVDDTNFIKVDKYILSRHPKNGDVLRGAKYQDYEIVSIKKVTKAGKVSFKLWLKKGINRRIVTYTPQTKKISDFIKVQKGYAKGFRYETWDPEPIGGKMRNGGSVGNVVKKGYHGTQKKSPSEIKPTSGRYGFGIYLTPDYKTAEYFGKQGFVNGFRQLDVYSNANVYEYDLSNLKIQKLQSSDEIDNLDKATNYDGIYLEDEGEIIIYNTNKLKDGKLKTKMRNGGNLSKTPAPLSERIKGSKFNASGSAKDSTSGEDIKFDDKTIASIQSLIDSHNEKYPSKKITLGVAKAVVRRGMGAYSSSHRPTITGGKPNSRTAWGLARLKAFIHKAEKGKSKSGKYSQDNDLFDDLDITVSKFANGGLIAPNGKPSNLTPEQYKLVRTKAFKDWFGDWENDPKNASKVVDENGEPLVVYRGIKNSSRNIFNRPKNKRRHHIDSRYIEWYEFGSFFTSSISDAEDYAEYKFGIESEQQKGKVLKVFLNIKNPLIKINKKPISWTQIIPNIFNSDYSEDADLHDGFISNNTIEIGTIGATTYHVKNPTQIKLADGTNTTFDGNNPDIRFSHGGSIELEKGIKAEYEHAKTIAKFKREGVSVRDVARSIAEDHLKEDPHYYSKLEKMEGKKFATGGIVENGISINIGDTGLYGRSKEQITITGITTKIVNFTTSDGKKKGIYIDSFAKNYIPDNPSNYVQSGSNKSTSTQTSGEWRVKTVDELMSEGLFRNGEYRGIDEFIINKWGGNNVEEIDKNVISNLNSGKTNFSFDGFNVGIGLFTKDPLPTIQSKSQTSGEWRVKTYDELKEQGLLDANGKYLGISDYTINRWGAQNLKELDKSAFTRINRGENQFAFDSYAVKSNLFTKDPLPTTQSKNVPTNLGQTQPKEFGNYILKKNVTRDDFKNTKIIVDTPEKSEALQKLLFELDIDWSDDYKSVQNIGKPYLFINESTLSKKQIIGYRANTIKARNYYESSTNKEIKFNDLFELKGQSKPVLSDESLQELFKDVKEIDKEREAVEATSQKNETQINDELKALEDEYNDLLFLIDITPSTDVDNMLALKLQAKQLKDKIDLLHLDLKKKIDGELELLENLFNASSVQPQERYKFNPYNDGFAPDGQPTSLPKNLYDWTMTQEFQNWFGNFTNAYNYRNSSYENVPCSVVVNKHYEPLVVYHGTGVEFSFFKFDKFPAMYFAENEAYSNWFAEIKGQQSGTNGYVYPFFLNIRIPLDLTIYGIDPVSPDEFIDWMFLQTGLDADELKISKALLDPSQKFQAWMYLRNSPEMLNVLRDKAICDGIIYYEDNPSVDQSSDAYQTKAYIVFNSNSAKIADPNREMMTIPAMRSFYLKRGGKL